MENIVYNRIKEFSIDRKDESNFITETIDFIHEIHFSNEFERPPSTAELLNWLLYLVAKYSIGKDSTSLFKAPFDIQETFPILVKSKNDLPTSPGREDIQ